MTLANADLIRRRKQEVFLEVEHADQANDYEVDRHNIVEQARHDQNKNTGDQRN